MEKKYQVYALGNALVDIEFKVSDDVLHQYNINKNLMTLIDESHAEDMMEKLSPYFDNKAFGGSAANAMSTFTKLGGSAFLSCKVANDSNGHFYRDDLIKSNLDSNIHVNSLSDGSTGICLVLLTPDTERTMLTSPAITVTLNKNDIREEIIPESNWLFIEGYLAASPSCLETALHAKSIAENSNVKIALTLSDPNMLMMFEDQMKQLLTSKLDLLLCNLQEAELLTQSKDLEVIKQKILKYTKIPVITLGSKGALVFDGSEFQHVPSKPVSVLDTTGAGDTFAGTFLYAINHGMSYVKATELANDVAGKVVSQHGPRLDKKTILEVTEV